jgi:hypothetical protein
MALGVVERPELRGSLPQTGVGSENAASALTLVADLDAKKGAVSTISISKYPPEKLVSIGPSSQSRSRCRIESRNSETVIMRFTYDATHLALPT